MSNKNKKLIFLLLAGILVLVIIIFLINKNYIIAGLLFSGLIVGLCYIGKLAAPLYFEKSILNLLKSNGGQIEKNKIVEYFRKSAPSIGAQDIEDSVSSTLLKLEKKKLINFEQDGNIIRRTGVTS